MTSYITLLPCAANAATAKAGASSGGNVLVHRRDRDRRRTSSSFRAVHTCPQQRSEAAIARGQFRKAAIPTTLPLSMNTTRSASRTVVRR